MQIWLLESALVDHFVSQEASPIERGHSVSHPVVDSHKRFATTMVAWRSEEMRSGSHAPINGLANDELLIDEIVIPDGIVSTI